MDRCLSSELQLSWVPLRRRLEVWEGALKSVESGRRRADKSQAAEMALREKTIDSIQIVIRWIFKTASRVTALKAKLKACYAEWAKGRIFKGEDHSNLVSVTCAAVWTAVWGVLFSPSHNGGTSLPCIQWKVGLQKPEQAVNQLLAVTPFWGGCRFLGAHLSEI